MIRSGSNRRTEKDSRRLCQLMLQLILLQPFYLAKHSLVHESSTDAMDFDSRTMLSRPMSSKNRRRYVRNLVELPFSQWNYIAWRTSSSSLSRCRFVLSHLLCDLCGLCRLLSCALPDLLHTLYSCISQLQISRLSRWNRNDRWIEPHHSAIRSKIGVSRATRWW